MTEVMLSTRLLRAMALTLNQFRLYSENHPIAQDSLKTLALETENYFAVNNKLGLGILQHSLVVEGKAEKDPSARDLARSFERMGIEALVIEKGIMIREMTGFLGLIAMRGKTLQEKGGFKAAFESLQAEHIKLSKGKFQLVEEGQEVADSSQIGAGGESGSAASASASAPQARSIADVIRRIKDEQSAPIQTAAPVPMACEEIITQLEKSPAEIAQLAVESTKDPAHLESVLRKITRYLIEGLLSFLVEQGKDITKALEKLAKELEKALVRAGETDAIVRLKEKIPSIFEEAADELRIQMVVKTCKDKPGDLKSIQKITSKLFKDKKVRERLEPSLRNDLIQVGLNEDQLESLFEKMDEAAEKKKKRVTVDAEELAELKRKAKLFDSGQGGGGEMVEKVKKLEREKKVILDEKERVDTVIRNLAEGLLVVDKNGKVVLMNPAAEKLLGVKQSDKVGKTVMESLSDEHVLSMTKGNLKDSEEQVAKNVEIVSLNDETRRVLQASTAVIENEDGHTVGMVSVLSDITKQKELENLKTQFVSNVSHELRTPLVAIQKSLALILGKEVGDITEEQQRFLDIAHRNIERLSRLINDLLDVHKLEATKMHLRPKKVPVKELVTHVLGTVDTWLKDKKINTECFFSDEAVEIEADPDRLTQIVTNLVGNAIKYTDEGGSIKVSVQSGVQDASIPGETMEFRVQDNGIGIAPQDQKKIFDKFVQVSLAQPAGVSSTGLGLTIVKELIELHSGRIWVESEAGKGSTFIFRLPKSFCKKEDLASGN